MVVLTLMAVRRHHSAAHGRHHLALFEVVVDWLLTLLFFDEGLFGFTAVKNDLFVAHEAVLLFKWRFVESTRPFTRLLL